MPKNLNNVKEDILLVTRELIKETGYSDLNIRKIASQCGVATGTVYNYYSSKYQIISEILLNEWNLMLRRMDQNSKLFTDLVDKLEIIFNELSIFMINVHGEWFQTHPVNNESNIDMIRIKEKTKKLRSQISEKIYSYTNSDIPMNDENAIVCDIIANILISYSNEKIDFQMLKPSLTALVNQLYK